MVIGEARPTDADVRHVQAQPGMGATAESQGQITPPRKHQGVLGGKKEVSKMVNVSTRANIGHACSFKRRAIDLFVVSPSSSKCFRKSPHLATTKFMSPGTPSI